METTHQVLSGDARDLHMIADASVHLIVTSPPYPMIEMWDETFARLNPAIGEALGRKNGREAFSLMHCELDRAWAECFRVLKPGGIACVNVGDATRTVAGDFRLYPNHSRIVQAMDRIGFTTLPDILWRKQTNAPNKFLGSGMLPAGAYVTYEHEYVLIFRKGPKRTFWTEKEKQERRESAFFWEERNVWFSDVWYDLKGAGQDLDGSARERSGAFPFELAYRLINMHSVMADLVLDPFAGTGTTIQGAIASARSSIGVEIDLELRGAIASAVHWACRIGSDRLNDRLVAHQEFVGSRLASGRTLKHTNRHFGFPVVTAQETELVLYYPGHSEADGPDRFRFYHTKAKPLPIQTSLFASDSQVAGWP